MLSIRREQREKMGEPAFVDRTMAFFRNNYIKQVYLLGDDELRARVEHGIAKARSYGLTWESSITMFVAHMISINPEFDKQKVIAKELIDPELPPDHRMNGMFGVVTAEDWDEAEKQSDAEAYWAKVYEDYRKEHGL